MFNLPFPCRSCLCFESYVTESGKLIFYIYFGTFYTLEEGQQAIIGQFGRPVGESVTAAGRHTKLPFVQEVRRFEKRLPTLGPRAAMP
jgi:regulator of protease activity HflC (stomatin/prohibitin superfamily)